MELPAAGKRKQSRLGGPPNLARQKKSPSKQQRAPSSSREWQTLPPISRALNLILRVRLKDLIPSKVKETTQRNFMRIEKIEDKCNQCLLCVRDCVAGVWHIVDGKSQPVDVELCNRCSHCVAVCPCGAIRHDSPKMEQIIGVNRKNLQPDVYRRYNQQQKEHQTIQRRAGATRHH